LDSGTADAALQITLPPGLYTIELRARGLPAGWALLELFEVD
jgi:hypothetical protein